MRPQRPQHQACPPWGRHSLRQRRCFHLRRRDLHPYPQVCSHSRHSRQARDRPGGGEGQREFWTCYSWGPISLLGERPGCRQEGATLKRPRRPGALGVRELIVRHRSGARRRDDFTAYSRDTRSVVLPRQRVPKDHLRRKSRSLAIRRRERTDPEELCSTWRRDAKRDLAPTKHEALMLRRGAR
jgi:hypothetical protein